MPLTTSEFLNKYSQGISKNGANAFGNLMVRRFGKMEESGFTVQIPEDIWKYDGKGVLQKVSKDEIDRTPTMVNQMLQGTVYVIPGRDADGQLDFTKIETITVAEYNGMHYVQMMDAATVKAAYEEKPVAEAPGFIDRLVDFFCRLVGKRDAVCALWDEVNRISKFAETLDTVKMLEENAEIAAFQTELVENSFAREEKALTEDEQKARTQKAKELYDERTVAGGNFKEELTEWYLAMYANTHEMFPAYIGEKTEIEMAQLDQQALTFAEGKIWFQEYAEKQGASYTRKMEFEEEFKRFDVRAALATTLAFAAGADHEMSTEDVFKVLAGEEVPNADDMKAQMSMAMAMLADPETRRSAEMQALIQKGTTRMCTLLEGQKDLTNGISYQLGRMIQRNQFAFGPSADRHDISMDLKISPMAKQIAQIQDEIIDSYNSNILQGFALFGDAGEVLTGVSAPLMLPLNAVGQTNAAFLDKMSKQPAGDREAFLKGNLPLLQQMNENLKGFISEYLEKDDCHWLKNPGELKAALNGGMVRAYHEAVVKGLKETGKMPSFRKEFDYSIDPNEPVYDPYTGEVKKNEPARGLS